MHRLKIFHFDIKPENLAYSRELKKWVFLDFNLSDMKQVELGSKVQMGFRGTLNFCYKEMFDLFNYRKTKGSIDPFYNDAYALSRSIKNFQEQLISQRAYE
jgi:serine/threonine protein kinase